MVAVMFVRRLMLELMHTPKLQMEENRLCLSYVG